VAIPAGARVHAVATRITLEKDGGIGTVPPSLCVVGAQKEFFGKGPTQAKSYFVDDMLIIVMKGGLTTAEKTMLDFGDANTVRDFRQTFENKTARGQLRGEPAGEVEGDDVGLDKPSSSGRD
jgi:Na+-translocating membrane potential-generating system (MpsC)